MIVVRWWSGVVCAVLGREWWRGEGCSVQEAGGLLETRVGLAWGVKDGLFGPCDLGLMGEVR